MARLASLGGGGVARLAAVRSYRTNGCFGHRASPLWQTDGVAGPPFAFRAVLRGPSFPSVDIGGRAQRRACVVDVTERACPHVPGAGASCRVNRSSGSYAQVLLWLRSPRDSSNVRDKGRLRGEIDAAREALTQPAVLETGLKLGCCSPVPLY